MVMSNPITKLNNGQTAINSTEFPVIDAHIHLGGRYRTEQYWEKYDLSDVISELRNLGI